MKVRIGDYVSLYYEGREHGDLAFTGLVLHVLEPQVMQHADNYSRWWSMRLLIGDVVKDVNVYWDDEVEIHRGA